MELKLSKGLRKALLVLFAAVLAGTGTLSLCTGELIMGGSSWTGSSFVSRSEDPVWWLFATILTFAMSGLLIYAYFKFGEE